LIISFISANFELSAIFANEHHDWIASFVGSNGSEAFPSGVVLVFAQTGVVGDA